MHRPIQSEAALAATSDPGGELAVVHPAGSRGLKRPPTLVSGVRTGVDLHTSLSHFTLETILGQRSRLENNAGLNPSTINPTLAYPGLTPVGGVWRPQKF